jgi:hypothetical protein
MLKRIPFLLEGRAETIDTTSEIDYMAILMLLAVFIGTIRLANI